MPAKTFLSSAPRLPTWLVLATLAAAGARTARAATDLTIAADGHSFVTKDGKPFFWMGDNPFTFQLASKTLPEIEAHLDRIKGLGFTVVLVGIGPKWDGGPEAFAQPWVAPNEAYFTRIDGILDRIKARGMHAWIILGGGSLSQEEPAGPRAYGEWIGARYKSRSEVIWLVQHDAVQFVSEPAVPVLRALATGLAKGITGREVAPTADDPAWDEMLATVNAGPFNAESIADYPSLANDRWLRFWGHETFGKAEQAYDRAFRDWQRAPAKPTVNGEPGYVDQTGGATLRALCWHTVMGGGYPTVFNDEEQLAGLSAFWTARAFAEYDPAPGRLMGNVGEGTQQIVAKRARDGHELVVYFPPESGSATVAADALAGSGPVTGRWYRPLSGEAGANAGPWAAGEAPTASKPAGWEDAVLALSRGGEVPGTAGATGEVPGTAGAAGSAGKPGSAGAAGTMGAAGDAGAVGGAAGSAAPPVGGLSGSAGAGGSSGQGGAKGGGSGSAGASAGGKAGQTSSANGGAGTAGRAGNGPSASPGGEAGSPPADSSGGCGCRLARDDSPHGALAGIGLAAWVWRRNRRRRSAV